MTERPTKATGAKQNAARRPAGAPGSLPYGMVDPTSFWKIHEEIKQAEKEEFENGSFASDNSNSLLDQSTRSVTQTREDPVPPRATTAASQVKAKKTTSSIQSENPASRPPTQRSVVPAALPAPATTTTSTTQATQPHPSASRATTAPSISRAATTTATAQSAVRPPTAKSTSRASTAMDLSPDASIPPEEQDVIERNISAFPARDRTIPTLENLKAAYQTRKSRMDAAQDNDEGQNEGSSFGGDVSELDSLFSDDLASQASRSIRLEDNRRLRQVQAAYQTYQSRKNAEEAESDDASSFASDISQPDSLFSDNSIFNNRLSRSVASQEAPVARSRNPLRPVPSPAKPPVAHKPTAQQLLIAYATYKNRKEDLQEAAGAEMDDASSFASDISEMDSLFSDSSMMTSHINQSLASQRATVPRNSRDRQSVAPAPVARPVISKPTAQQLLAAYATYKGRKEDLQGSIGADMVDASSFASDVSELDSLFSDSSMMTSILNRSLASQDATVSRNVNATQNAAPVPAVRAVAPKPTMEQLMAAYATYKSRKEEEQDVHRSVSEFGGSFASDPSQWDSLFSDPSLFKSPSAKSARAATDANDETAHRQQILDSISAIRKAHPKLTVAQLQAAYATYKARAAPEQSLELESTWGSFMSEPSQLDSLFSDILETQASIDQQGDGNEMDVSGEVVFEEPSELEISKSESAQDEFSLQSREIDQYGGGGDYSDDDPDVIRFGDNDASVALPGAQMDESDVSHETATSPVKVTFAVPAPPKPKLRSGTTGNGIDYRQKYVFQEVKTPQFNGRKLRKRVPRLDHYRNEYAVYGHKDQDSKIPTLLGVVRNETEDVTSVGPPQKKRKVSEFESVPTVPALPVKDLRHALPHERTVVIPKPAFTPLLDDEEESMIAEGFGCVTGALKLAPGAKQFFSADPVQSKVFFVARGFVVLIIGDKHTRIPMFGQFVVPPNNDFMLAHASAATTAAIVFFVALEGDQLPTSEYVAPATLDASHTSAVAP